jgi:hypothetical protein
MSRNLILEYCPNIQYYWDTTKPITPERHLRHRLFEYAVRKRDFALISAFKAVDAREFKAICLRGDLSVIKYLNSVNLLKQDSYAYPGCLMYANRVVLKYLGASHPKHYRLCITGRLKALRKLTIDDVHVHSCLYLSHSEGQKKIYDYLDNKYLPSTCCIRSVLDGACEGGYIDVIMTHEKHISDGLLISACRGGHIGVVKFLINKGLKIHDYDIYQACLYGHAELVQFLLSEYCGEIIQGHFSMDIKMILKTKGQRTDVY